MRSVIKRENVDSGIETSMVSVSEKTGGSRAGAVAMRGAISMA
jgi:hypothetical protein